MLDFLRTFDGSNKEYDDYIVSVQEINQYYMHHYNTTLNTVDMFIIVIDFSCFFCRIYRLLVMILSTITAV